MWLVARGLEFLFAQAARLEDGKSPWRHGSFALRDAVCPWAIAARRGTRPVPASKRPSGFPAPSPSAIPSAKRQSPRTGSEMQEEEIVFLLKRRRKES